MVGLGTLGGAQSWAHGINDFGQAVGKSNVPVGTGADQAFVWTPTTPNGSTGTMLSIGVLGTGRSSEAYAINNAGQIAGWSYWTNDPVYENEHRAFLWTPDTPNGSTGTMVNLGTLGGSWSVATSISQDGKVAGWSALPGGSPHAFLWTPGGTAGPSSNPQMQDLGALNGYNTLALGVNSAGQVVGQTCRLVRAARSCGRRAAPPAPRTTRRCRIWARWAGATPSPRASLKQAR